MRRTTLITLGALLALALVLGGAWTLLNLAARHTFTTRTAYVGVRSLKIEDDTGDVTLIGAPADSQLIVTAHVTEDLSTPHRSATRGAGGALELKTDCSVAVAPACDVHYDILVPAGVTIDAHSGSGDVTASDIDAATVKLSTGTGDVSAQLDAPAQQLSASSGTGDVHLRVPYATYALHASTGTGDVSDGSIPTEPASPRHIHASSGTGDVTVSLNR